MANDAHFRALIWRCRRGMRELDVLLSGFLTRCYKDLESGEQQAFEALLEEQDPEIFGYLVRGVIPEQVEVANIVASILDDAKSNLS